MVYIKKVEIFGFKSFGFKNTVVQFEPGLVSISGPNGSGKSNILDAIIFATCEKSPSVMRVDKIRSLLHDIGGGTRSGKPDQDSNTSTVKPNRSHRGRRMARVTLHFDNTDRKIPVPSDTVSITRELEEDGETTYYLNDKKDHRSHIVDVLDVARVGPGNLNVVQQGTVTRIAEYSPVEKRHAIEDLVGISTFDEKAEKAKEQLDFADRKLEVALASMDEVKNQIDMLEVERNQKMRHDLILSDLKRYKAIDAIAQLRKIRTARASKEDELENAASTIKKLEDQRGKHISDTKELEDKRSRLMESEANYKHKKAALESQISSSVQMHDAAQSRIGISATRISQHNTRLAHIANEIKTLTASKNYTNAQMQKIKSSFATVQSSRDEINDQLTQIDSELDKILQEQTNLAARRADLDGIIKKLNDQKNKLIQQKLASSQNRTNYGTQITEYASKLENVKQTIRSLEASAQKLDGVMKNSRDTISHLKSKIKHLGGRRAKAISDKAALELLLEKSNNAATKYESKIKTVKGFMHEDYTAVKLKENSESLGILGLVYEMMSWDKKYERPVMAASSDWIKAMVVKDFDAMLRISDAARVQKLPKFKIIPLDAIEDMLDEDIDHAAAAVVDTAANTAATITDGNELSTPSHSTHSKLINGLSTLGTLADHVRCPAQYDSLRTFLFGNVVLVGDRDSAIAISKSGYKAVTTSGEYFEEQGGTIVVDLNSKISKITKLISMSGDVDGLLKSISLIRRYVQKKGNSIKNIDATIKSCTEKMSVSERRLAAANTSADYVNSRLRPLQDALVNIPQKLSDLRGTLDDEGQKIASYLSQIERLQNEINLANAKFSSDEHMQITEQLGAANKKKSDLNTRHTEIMAQYSRISSELSDMTGSIAQLESQYEGFKNEEKSLNAEIPNLEETIEKNKATKESESAKLTVLRQQEQDLISASGSSMDMIKDYDAQLTILRSEVGSMSKEIGALERSSDKIGHDLDELSKKEEDLRRIVTAANSLKMSTAPIPDSTDADDQNILDVSQIVNSLESELGSLAELNANAPAKYAAITHGYKMKSVRKNSLESERNAIVEFINRIERDKRQTFLDAFETMDSEIRKVFKKMTGGEGSAWLELQDEDEIFSSGISYLVQFPDKPHRESTSISGGEKTLAAIVFVLGLQKLQPSPFYLFDEVDAHLDAPNAEKLSNILAERSRGSQFIVVSLKDSVVQKAGLVYGVYPKAGVSNVVTYKDRRFHPSSSSPQPVAR